VSVSTLFRWRGWTQLVVPFLLMAAVFGIWELLARTVYAGQAYVLPRPLAVFQQIASDWDVLQPALWQTVKEFVIGFFVGTGCGFVLAVAMGQSRVLRRGLYPALIASQAVPIIAIAFALVIWLGFGLAPKVAVVALFIFFPVVVNVLDGLTNVDRDTVSLARAMGANRWRIFLHVSLPATLAPLFSALKLAAAFAVTGAVIGEQIASTTGGLGVYLLEQNSRLQTAGVFAAILLLSAIGIVGFLLVVVAEQLATPWRTRATPRRLRFRQARTSRGRALPASIKGGTR
jgi:ABC-type nitrate/sulfonate/bicarbonate transport system permease component